MAVPKETVAASAAVPFIYRLLLTVVEPLFALNGAVMVFVAPANYLSMVTRDTGVFRTESTFLYTCMGGGWLYLAFVEAIVLRACDDLRLWRLLCLGMLLSMDLSYCVSAVQAVGGWAVWSDLSAWTLDDHLVFWGTVPFALVRVLFLLGVGIKSGDARQKVQ
jgi:hypothetical protein